MWRPGTIDDIRNIEIRDQIAGKTRDDAIRAASMLGSDWCAENTLAIEHKDYGLMGIIGWVEQSKGVWEAFALVDTKSQRHPAYYVAESRAAIDDAIANHTVRALYVAVDPDDEQAISYAEALAFEEKCVLPDYFKEGEDRILMERLD